MSIEFSQRLKALPGYPLAEIPALKRRLIERGVDVIDLGAGDNDTPPPTVAVEAMTEALADPAYSKYGFQQGLLAFRQAAVRWVERRFGFRFDPTTETLPLIGSKEGLSHLPLAVVNPGDATIIPEPGYQAYIGGSILAGAEPHVVPLRPENRFLLELEQVPEAVLRRAKLVFLNYPNNPTAAVANPEFFARVVDFARRHQLIVCHDAMYSELRFDGYRPPSFLETPGAMEVGVEFHSLSKTYSMTGWRLGFCCGNAGALAGLGKIKTNVDSGVFQAVQEAGIAALTGPQDIPEQYRKTYQDRRDVVVAGLKRLGWDVDVPKAAFFVWAPVPGGLDSRTFAARMLNEVGCVITPGVGFGPSGEGFYRIALTIDAKRLQEAMDRLKGLKL